MNTIDTLRTSALSVAAAAALGVFAAGVYAQSPAANPAAPAGAPAAQVSAGEAAKLPAYLKQGAAPPANDPVPAPTSPAAPPNETAAAQAPAPPAGTVSAPGSATPRNWTTDQILTATVHQAWILAGKDETNFFEIVKELAAISASNRNLVLPDTPEAGRKAGEYIRTQAKEDHDQLLYEIVDKAVRMTGTKAAAAPAGE